MTTTKTTTKTPTNVNIHKIKFGAAMTVAKAKKHCKDIYEGAYKLDFGSLKGQESNDEAKLGFVGRHYWYAHVVNVKTKERTVKPVRLDYFLNFQRVPTFAA